MSAVSTATDGSKSFAKPTLPAEIIDQIIALIFNDENSETTRRTRQSLPLVNSAFRHIAQRHTKLIFRFDDSSLKRLQKYISFVRDNPGTIIPSCVLDLNIMIETPGYIYEDAVAAFLAWENYFPNVKSLTVEFEELCQSSELRLVNAMRGIIASPRLESLEIHSMILPADYFCNPSSSLKRLELLDVTAPDGLAKFPNNLKSLTVVNLDLIHQARHKEPDIFASIDEITLVDCRLDSYKDWEFIYSLSDSLNQFSFHGDAPDIPRDLNAIDFIWEKLETLTVTTGFGENPNDYIHILSTLLPVDIGYNKPNFTLRVVLVARDDNGYDHTDVVSFDEWITEYLPSTIALQVHVEVLGGTKGNEESTYRKLMQNCVTRGILSVHITTLETLLFGNE